MTEQGKVVARRRGYDVRRQERNGDHAFWIYLSNYQVGCPYGAEVDAWSYVQTLISRNTYGIGCRLIE